jgi:hypothetical protein
MTGSIEKLATALENNACLTKLNLQNNQINGKTFRILATALQKNKILTHLNLSSNKLSDADVPTLIELCAHMPNLTELILTEHYILSNSMQAFFTFLETNQTLTSLVLSTPNDTQTLKILTESLKRNSTLTKLELALNFVCSDEHILARNLCEGYEALSDLLTVNSTIIFLDIGLPPLYLLDPIDIRSTQKAYAKVQQAVKKNQAKTVIKYLPQSLQPHSLGAIKPILEIIADYAGKPSVIQPIAHPKPIPPLAPKISFLEKLRAAWNKFCILINHLWNHLKNKFKTTAHTIPVLNDTIHKPAAVLSQTEKIEFKNARLEKWEALNEPPHIIKCKR